MRILQLCKKLPYPLKDGESIAVTYLSRALVNLGCEVTLLSMNTSKHHFDINEIPLDYNHYKEIHTIEVDNRVKPHKAFLNLFSNESYHITRFISEDFKSSLIKILENNDFDIVQLETLYLTPYIDTVKKHSNALVTMRSHNIEFEIWERIVKNTNFIPKKLYLNHLTKKLKKYELDKLNDYDYLVAISDRDLSKFKKLGYKNGAMSTPIGLELNNYISTAKPQGKASICFIGALDWIPNFEGLTWFLNSVWPIVVDHKPDVTFHIAGRNTPDSLLKINMSNVIVHGEIEDAVEFIASHDIMVVPLFSGSGMRVKILEGMALGRAIVSTTLGKEGIGARDGYEIIVADNANEFAHKIINLIENKEHSKEIGNNAIEFVKNFYDHNNIAAQLLEKYQILLESGYKAENTK
jgi:glycosyltransferase involved in cell wall biosynthesis